MTLTGLYPRGGLVAQRAVLAAGRRSNFPTSGRAPAAPGASIVGRSVSRVSTSSTLTAVASRRRAAGLRDLVGGHLRGEQVTGRSGLRKRMRQAVAARLSHFSACTWSCVTP